MTTDEFVEAVVQPIKNVLEEKDREYRELLARFDRLRDHAANLETFVAEANKSNDEHLNDIDDENEELKAHIAYLSDLLVRICGFAESEQADDADRWRAFFKEVDDVAKGTMSMRSDAWLQMSYVEMTEYERVCDELATKDALLSESMPDLSVLDALGSVLNASGGKEMFEARKAAWSVYSEAKEKERQQ